MQEKRIKTWNDTGLFLIAFLLEIILFFIISHYNFALGFVISILCLPFYLFAASYICFKLPIFHWSTFSFYFTENLPEDRTYHILKADEDGYILYKEAESSLVDIWRIDNPIIIKSVREIWDEL